MKKLSTMILCLLLFAVTLPLAGCSNQLTITFDAGEYGAFDGETTRSFEILSSGHIFSDVQSPSVTANDGYVFLGFSPSINELPRRGKVTCKAQYATLSFRFSTKEEGEYSDRPEKLTLPSFGPIAGYIALPQVEVSVTNIQTGAVEKKVLDITTWTGPDGKDYYPLPFDLKLQFEMPEDNEFVYFGGKHVYQRDSSREDWETTAAIKFLCGIDADNLAVAQAVDFTVATEHTRVTAIEKDGYWRGKDPDTETWQDLTSRPARSGYLILVDFVAHYEDGTRGWGIFTENIIERVWSIHGDEISPDDFDSYAYDVEDAHGYIQLTDLVSNGWRVDFHFYYPKDDIKSETYTIEIF